MSKIIFLNGPGSAGKSSIAKSLSHLSNELWLTFGVDSFIEMLPLGKQESYFKFISSENERGPLLRVEQGANSHKIFGIMPTFAKMLADEGNNLIIDEILFDETKLEAYAKCLSNHTVYFIGIFCDLNIMQEREILRGDRAIGLSNDQIDRVHHGKLGIYDLKVDTTHLSPFGAAKKIQEFIHNNSTPTRFKALLG